MNLLTIAAMSRILRKRVWLVGGILLGAYVGVYLLDAAFGGYDPHYASDGRSRYGGALLAHDCIMWQPRFGSYYNADDHDFLGIVFFPLLQLDHRYFHRTHAVGDDDFGKWWGSLTLAKIHPGYRADFESWKKVKPGK